MLAVCTPVVSFSRGVCRQATQTEPLGSKQAPNKTGPLQLAMHNSAPGCRHKAACALPRPGFWTSGTVVKLATCGAIKQDVLTLDIQTKRSLGTSSSGANPMQVARP